ncbi:MAG: protein-glutamate O-methyltransferase CheR [Gammaproteobacteria bacterium]|nr:protein-glutamate O-methyltransferase CheR [Gammaproteobacteria bacterium]
MISDQEYSDFCSYLEEATGIVLGTSKHYLVSSRLNRLMEDRELASYTELLEHLKKSGNAGLREQIIDAMTTNETMWFRDTYPYEVLKETILPELSKIKDRPIIIWSSACSSGQEPYSISMVIQEYISKNAGVFPRGIQVIATDISTSMLNYSKRAKYDEAAMKRGVSEERRRKFFTLNEDLWEVVPEVRSRVSFKPLNLQQSFTSLGKFDLIFCRNVLIYFSSEFKTDILTRMAGVTNPDGYLYLGSSESPTRYTAIYKMVRTPGGVIYQYAP